MIKSFYTTIFFLCFACLPLKSQMSIVEIMYNNPGEDLYEYIKVWNTSGQTLNLAGASMTRGIEATFPDIDIPPGQWFFVVSNAEAFESAFYAFGQPVIAGTGALNNSGETITIVNADGSLADEVTYNDGGGWPTFADGNGSSLHFCGTSNDDKNDPELWNLTPANLNLVIDDQPLYGLLGDIFFQCTERGVASFFNNRISVLEDAGTASIPVYINRAEQSMVNVEVSAADGTAVAVDDFELVSTSVSSDTDTVDVFMLELTINDDEELESDETFTISFPGFSDQYLALTNSIEVTIIDNDTPLTENLILTGVWDAQPGFAGTKGAEFYALNDIADLSVFGVGVVNNGNGTDGVEFTFPAISVDAGTFIYLAEEEQEFMDYFGFAPDATFPEINVNGDDAIELFENAQPLDVFGDANMDGSGTAWEYLDGWAYRIDGTTQDGSTFAEGNWRYSGVDALDGPATNAEASNPFPLGTYSNEASEELIVNDDNFTFAAGVESGVLNVIANDQIPLGIDDMAIESPPYEISVSINENFEIEFTTPPGYCGTDAFSYAIFSGNNVEEGLVNLTIECPAEFNLLTIGDVTTEDANGVADSLGVDCELIGTVYGVNLSSTGLLFTIIDDAGDGIAVFNNDSDLGYTVTEGDAVAVRGTITQFNGLTEIEPVEIDLLSQGNSLLSPRFKVGALDESTESNLVEITGTYEDITQWGGGNSGFNFTVVSGLVEYEVRIDNDVDLFLLPAPGDPGVQLNIVGIGGQFDNSSPFDEGYQLLPRYEADITFGPGGSAQDVLGIDIDMYPNPADMTLNLNTEEALDAVNIMDALGRNVIQLENLALQSTIDVNHLVTGIYTVQCVKDGKSFTLKLVVQ